jgi:hypothetical protein
VAATTTVTSFIDITNAAREVFHALTWPARTGNIVDDEPAPVFAASLGGPTRRSRPPAVLAVRSRTHAPGAMASNGATPAGAGASRRQDSFTEKGHPPARRQV